MSLRNWFAGHEQLSDYDHPDIQVPKDMMTELAGPTPKRSDFKSDRLFVIACLRWDAKWRAEPRYIRADAMIAAKGGEK